jgi:hypothetical protein
MAVQPIARRYTDWAILEELSKTTKNLGQDIRCSAIIRTENSLNTNL